MARFEHEAHVLASLNHVNIAAIFSVTDVDGVRALVLELVDGPTSGRSSSRPAPIPLADVVTIARQITVGLEAAHSRASFIAI